MINCAHPTHFEAALDPATRLARRASAALRANASTKSHAELDEAEDLDEGDPVDLGARHAALRDSCRGSTCSAAAAAPTTATWARSSKR